MNKFTRKLLIVFLISTPLLSILIYQLVNPYGSRSNTAGIPRVQWQLLRELDLATGVSPKELQDVNGKKVMVPGFVVPLEDNAAEATEFLLVPNPQACIHVPPPPANQMVHVRMEGGKSHKLTFGPIWVVGVLRMMETENVYGKVSFYLTAESTERYTE